MFVGIVVRMIVVMSMMMGTRRMNRLKHLLHLGICNLQAVQHLPDRRVVLHQKIILAKLGGKMKVADLPCIVCCLLCFRVGHAEHPLGLLFKRVHLAIYCMEGLAMAQRVFKVKAEFPTIGCGSTPPALGQGATVSDEFDSF